MFKRVAKTLLHPARVALTKAIIKPPPPVTMTWGVNLSLIEKASWFVAADKIEGDYLEFGVFRGDSFATAFNALRSVFALRVIDSTPDDAKERQAIWNGLRFFAFDSFEGLPPLSGIDQMGKDFAAGQYAASRETFLQNISRKGVDLNRVVCIPGWFEETCTLETIKQHRLTKAAIVWIDCDLYHSCKSVLSFIEPLLQDGTILIFDDWYAFRGNPKLGEQRAMREWSDTVNGFTFAEYQREGPWRTSFICSSAVPT